MPNFEEKNSMLQKLLFWPLFWLAMGVLIGGSIVWSSAQQTAIAMVSNVEGDRLLAEYTLWLTAFTAAVAIGTFVLGGATLLLYSTGEKQIKLSREIATQQSLDMQRSIQVANDANQLSRESFLYEQRPWLSFSDVKFNDIDYRGGISAEVFFHIKNSGRSPALSVSVSAMLLTITSKAADKEADFRQRVASQFSNWAVFPEETFIHGHIIGLTKDEVEFVERTAGGVRHINAFILAAIQYKSPSGNVYSTFAKFSAFGIRLEAVKSNLATLSAGLMHCEAL